jgi:hypothetical protein
MAKGMSQQKKVKKPKKLKVKPGVTPSASSAA